MLIGWPVAWLLVPQCLKNTGDTVSCEKDTCTHCWSSCQPVRHHFLIISSFFWRLDGCLEIASVPLYHCIFIPTSARTVYLQMQIGYLRQDYYVARVHIYMVGWLVSRKIVYKESNVFVRRGWWEDRWLRLCYCWRYDGAPLGSNP